VKQGDPYAHQIKRTYELVVERGAFGLPHHLCFQSKVGPQRWLEPSLTATIEELGRQRVTHTIVVPIAFVSDHLETLSEIAIEAKHQATQLGVKYFAVTAPLLTSEPFIRCLGELVLEQLHT
jgi:ferrochelatase